MRILAFLGKILLWIIGCFMGLLLIINLFVPVYDFDEPHAFSGSYLHNPYEGIDSTTWLRCNFHAHSRIAGGVTNGRNNTPQLIDSVYNILGFSHRGISNYNKICDFGSQRSDFIPAYEHGYGIFKIHQLCLNAQKARILDYPFWQTLSMKQHTLNQIGKHCELVIPAHPNFVKGGYRASDFKYLDNYKLMEVLNGYCLSPEHWDTALSNGHRIYLIGDDDSHNVFNINEIAKCFTLVASPITDSQHILAALKAGQTVGIFFPFDNSEKGNPEKKKKRLDTFLPHPIYIHLSNDTLRIAVSKNIQKAEFIGQDGKILKTENNIDEALYAIQENDCYVRTVLTFEDGTEMWLNPITRHENPSQLDAPQLHHLNYWKTGLLWTAYLIVIGGILYFVIRKKSARQ